MASTWSAAYSTITDMWQEDLLDWKPEPEPARPLPVDREAEAENQCRARILLALEAGVPLQVAELRATGGPKRRHHEIARAFAVELGSKGDVLMYGSKKRGEVAALMNGLIFAVAIGAFQPGGVTVFGMHFEA